MTRGLVPLERLRNALASRHPDALSPVMMRGMPEEIRPLLETLNALLERVQRAMIREQRFTDDAAHELRTPLTAIKTHLQVATRVEGEASRQALAHAETGVARLSRTLEQLLMLARLEGQLPFEDGETCRVDDVASLAQRDASPSPSRIVSLTDWPPVSLAVPRELAVTALRNLIDNALRHGPEEAPVHLSATTLGDGERLMWRVRDHGPDLDESTLAQLPQRFWRTSRSQGSGLGLAIVTAIAERCGGTLSFARPASGGVEARLILPIGGRLPTKCSVRREDSRQDCP
ncbi:ATP-binding protein [Halomonas cupida]|uniref:ATP-binding protein n=1 Tax=Halomonas cupida TaxID=44933 RepID=UPI003EF30654